MQQLDLFGPPEPTLDDKFEEFHEANPHIFARLVNMALDELESGVKRGSVKRMIENLRADPSCQTDSKDWKLNNSHASRYARLIMKQEPELDGFFEVRGLKS